MSHVSVLVNISRDLVTTQDSLWWSHIGPASLPSINWSLSPLQVSSQLRSMLITEPGEPETEPASPLLDTLIKVF